MAFQRVLPAFNVFQLYLIVCDIYRDEMRDVSDVIEINFNEWSQQVTFMEVIESILSHIILRN